MARTTSSADIERLQRRRTRLAIFQGLLFWAAVSTALGLQVLSLFEPLPAGQALHYVLTLGVGIALMTFGVLERRAQRDG